MAGKWWEQPNPKGQQGACVRKGRCKYVVGKKVKAKGVGGIMGHKYLHHYQIVCAGKGRHTVGAGAGEINKREGMCVGVEGQGKIRGQGARGKVWCVWEGVQAGREYKGRGKGV